MSEGQFKQTVTDADEYAEWLMEPGAHRICNGNDLVLAMENTTNQENFLKWKAGI